MHPIAENSIEASAIEILQQQGWIYANGRDISPEGLFCERDSFAEAVLLKRLREAFAKINPHIPTNAQGFKRTHERPGRRTETATGT